MHIYDYTVRALFGIVKTFAKWAKFVTPAIQTNKTFAILDEKNVNVRTTFCKFGWNFEVPKKISVESEPNAYSSICKSILEQLAAVQEGTKLKLFKVQNYKKEYICMSSLVSYFARFVLQIH